MLPVAVVRLYVGVLHAIGWGEGPWALVTPVEAIRLGNYKKLCYAEVMHSDRLKIVMQLETSNAP